MQTHVRNYAVMVNEVKLPFSLSATAISNEHIDRAKNNFIHKQKKLGRIKEGDNVVFIFKYANSTNY